MIESTDYRVILLDMPLSVRSVETEDENGYSIIYINARHSYETQKKACDHELEHIIHDDLRSKSDADLIEYLRHETGRR